MTEYRTGDIIDDRYEVQSFLGKGGQGLVLRVHRILDGRDYAMKIFKAGAPRETVQRELKALQAVHHPNIQKVVWADQLYDGRWYLLTELVEGAALEEFTTPDRLLPLQQVVTLGRQLLSALESLHPDIERIDELQQLPELGPDEMMELQELQSQGFVHRDIKPQNLIVHESGHLVLIDFGIASKVGAPKETDSSTHGYVPPDASPSKWDPGVDLYAAGITLYELACGASPHGDDDEPIDPKKHRPAISSAFANFLRSACAPDQSRRFRSARHMADALAELENQLENQPDDVAAVPKALLDYMQPYRSWAARPLPGAGGARQDELTEILVEMVEAEGPALCARLYSIYVEASGDPGVVSVRSPLNKAIYAAVRNGRINQVEPLGGGQADKTVFPVGGDSVVVRQRGPRSATEIPASELMEAAGLFLDEEPELKDDDIVELLLLAYELEPSDFWPRYHFARSLGLEVEVDWAAATAPD